MHERGFVYDSSLMGDDIPYFVGVGDQRMVELPVHWATDDAPYYTFMPVAGRTAPMATPNNVLTAWQWEFDGAYRDSRAFMLTMHPHTTGRYARLEAQHRLIKHMKACGASSSRVASIWRIGGIGCTAEIASLGC
jgi:hypothetical protein